MSDNTGEESDQAKELRQLLAEVEGPESANDIETKSESSNTRDDTQKIDVLNLPPRKEVHRGKSSRIKLKVNKPYIRFMIVVLLIIILFAGGFYLWGDELVQIINHI